MNDTSPITRAAGFLELDDVQAAESELSLLSHEERNTPDAISLQVSLEMAKCNFSKAAEIVTSSKLNQTPKQRLNTHYLLSLAGNHRAAYEGALATEAENITNPLYWFNRACNASLCGEIVDSVNSLGRCLLGDTHLMTDCFLDPDLDAMWDYLEFLEPSAYEAEFLLFPGWRDAIRRWKSRQDPIVVPWACRERLPEQIRQFVFWQNLRHTLKIYPTAPPAMSQEFENWKWTTSELKVGVLRGVIQRARVELLKHQAKFAFDQARADNFTAARHHLIYLLAAAPDYPLHDFLFMDNLLGFLLDDIKPAMREDALFCRKIEQARFAMDANDPEAAGDFLDSVLPVGRKTNLYTLHLCHFENSRNRQEVASEIARKLLAVWPFEISLTKMLLDEAMNSGDWDMAEMLLKEAHPSFQDFNVYESIKQSVEDREIHDHEEFLFPFEGHRNLGGQLHMEAALRADIGPFILRPKTG
jgi:hypothetical protein